MLLGNVRAPARDARCSEQRRIQLRRKPEHPKYWCGIKVHIGAEMFLAIHHFFELFANRYPIFLAGALPEFTCDLSHHRHARIAFFVNTMTETHDFLFGTELL